MKKKVMKRWLSAFLAAIMVFSGLAYDLPVVNATAADYESEETTVSEGSLIYVDDTVGDSEPYSDDETEDDLLYEEADDVPYAGAGDYGLSDNVQDGVILHAWNWSFRQIQQELPKIAEAGFTAVQTSPIQPNKDGSNVANTGEWWKFYQPVDFAVCSNGNGNINKLGTRQEFIDLCKEADKYGIKIIVDVVANHLANISGPASYPAGQYNSKEDRSNQIPSNIRNNDSYWHWPDDKGSSDDGNRWQMTRGQIGMPDLNTGNEALQDYIIDFLLDAQECGAAGFRFDAAKHIETPSDQGFASQFWAKVKSKTQEKDPNVFLYGEILNTAGPGNYSDMQKYTPYIRVTNNVYANSLREGIKNRSADYAKFTNNDRFGSNGNEWVLWNESHDTYAGDYGEFTDQNFTDEEMALAWCAVAARTSPALYFSRPTSSVGRKVWSGNPLGSHTNMYQDSRIAAVNKFHNQFAGTTEYVTTNNNVLVVERGTEGVVLVNFGRGSKSVNIPVNKMKDGTYVDQVTKSTFTVNNKTLTGTIGDGGVAAICNAEPVVKTPRPTISKEGGNFSSDTLTLTIGLSNATSGTYKIGNQSAETYTSSKTITIGSDMAFGDSVTITLTATDGTKTETKSYTFTKVEQTGDVVYLSLPSGWGKPVYCYAFASGVTPAVENKKWPGAEMTLDAATGYYKYEIPDTIENPEVILHDNAGNRTSPDQQPGKVVEGSWLYKDGGWKEYAPTPPSPTTGKVIVKYVDESGNSVAAQQTLTGTVGTAYNTTAASPAGYVLKTTPANASGKYTSADITVIYVYTKVQGNVLNVTSSLAEGAEFTTETTTITLTAQNATSATYCVDDGPVKNFSGSAQVVIGQGKIADTQVKVKVTATNGTDTVNKTFTYNKKFSGKVVNETAGSLPRAASMQSEETVRSGAGNAFASNYYKVNPSGTGKEGTISSASDWTAAHLIAQGVANDDSNVFKGPHECPVYDTYTLYGAYDDANLYIGWQIVNVRDVVASDQKDACTNQAKPYIAPIPQMLALDLGQSKGAYGDGSMEASSKDPTVWNMKVKFNTNANALLLFSSKYDGTPALFLTDSNGKYSYNEPYCKTFAKCGITYEYEDGLFAGISSLNGIKKNAYTGYTTDMIFDNNSAWEDLSVGHNSSLDTFYTITIPYTALGITKDYIKNNGIGVMHISTFGESGIASIPADESMYDNATEPYSQDPSSTAEKEDEDIITCSFARIGKEGGANPNPDPGPNPTPDPEPTPTPDLTVNFGADRSSPQLNTTTLTLKAIASGGKSSYTYEFFVDGASVQSRSSRDTYIWRPSAGSHTIKVTVTDSNGKTVSSQKAYAIEGNGDQPIIDPTKINFSFADPNARYIYDGTPKKAGVIVSDGTKTLRENTDYSLLYYNYINAGDKDSQNPPTVIVVGKGDYASKIINHVMTYTIEKAAIPDGAPESEMRANAGPVSALTLNAGWEWSEADRNAVLETGKTISITAVYNGADKANYMITTMTVSLTGISCDHTGTEKETIITVAPSCTQNGRKDVICKECHTKIEGGEVIPALGHIGGTATCSSQATCGRCKQKYGDFNNENHANIAVHNKKEANCQQAGYTGDAICEDCNSLIASGKPVAKTGHKWDGGKVTKTPTATADGIRTYTCTVCKTATRTETIPKTGGGGSPVPSPGPQVGEPVMDTASKGIYKVTKASSTVKTVEYILPSVNAKTVTVPASISVKGTTYKVTSIADNAFKNNKTIQTVKIGSNVKTIGASAFSGCTRLKKVTLASGTASIGSKAFYKCTKLTSITIPSKVSKIGSKAFYGCKKLKKITIKTSKLTKGKVGSQAFKGIAAKATIKVPKKKLSSYKKILKARGVSSKAKIKK